MREKSLHVERKSSACELFLLTNPKIYGIFHNEVMKRCFKKR